MKKNFAYAVFALAIGYISLISTQALPLATYRNMPFDSVGLEKKDGKLFILHRVNEGQTLFAIARKYKRSVAEIKAANPTMKDAVKYDQLLRIPAPDGTISRKEERAMDKAIRKREKEEKRAAKATEDKKSSDNKPTKESQKNEDPARAGIHVVEPHQTLYSLANRYGVLQADIRRWNNLPGNNVLIGQALIVSEKAYLARTPASQVVPRPSKPVERSATSPAASAPKPTPAQPTTSRPAERKASKPNRSTDVASKPSAPESQSTASTQPVEEVELPSPGNDAPMPTQGRRISASGVAEMINGSDGSGKYLALHRTAPIGTLVQVRNEFNNQSLWVKVIGRLPNTGVNDKILIKLSGQAFAKLSPEDKRFRAEVSYIVR
ncbi:hypothetical protein GCM10028807_44410 [Spirosoma daeguense]